MTQSGHTKREKMLRKDEYLSFASMAIAQVFVTACLIGIAASAYNGCPPHGVLEGCKCSYSHMVFMQCRGEKSIEEFRNMLQNQNLNREKMDLSFVSLKKESKLTSRMFDGFHIESLYVWGSPISRWADKEGGPAFVGLEDTLETLEIVDSIRKDDESNDKAVMTLGHLRKLRVVQFSKNRIYSFGKDWFGEGGSSVEVLVLGKVLLHHLGDRAFADLTGLRHINIYGNPIDSVARRAFPNPATHLRKFSLRSNKITSLPEDIFTNMPALVDVDLSYNSITQLPASIWRPVWSQLGNLDLRHTDLKCDDDGLKWIFAERIPRSLEGDCYDTKISSFKNLRDFIKEKQAKRQ